MPANRDQLKDALQKPYDRLLFAKDVLRPTFNSLFSLNAALIKPAVELNQTESSVIDSVGIYGKINLEDSTEVICYEILLKPNVRLEYSKVAIQHYVRKLLTAGQAALINFISPSNNNFWRLTLVAKDSVLTEKGIKEKTTYSKRYTFLLGPSETCRTASERFEILSTETKIDSEKLVNAFSVEKLSKAFFDEYTHHYKNFIDYLVKPSIIKSIFNGDEKATRDFSKKLLGRIVFLYFVQKKRWLGAADTNYTDGKKNFIKQLFIQSGGNDSFYPNWLTKLFFETLNKERKDDVFEMPDGKKVKIPFLNGGLFDKEDHDDKLISFPSKLFHNPDNEDDPNYRGFLDFLDSFNFTVYEDSPDEQTVAVDPEMLGHIFENLLEDNKDKGAFYTPKEIVHYMCQESLIEYLATHLSKEYKVYRPLDNDQIEFFGNESRIGQLKLLEEFGDKALNRDDVAGMVKTKNISKLTNEQLHLIDQLLDNVKICDPAIGSGAFPMGLLQEIYSIKELIAYDTRKEWKPAEVKENIIQNSIYGVDIEKGAVDIARLRFWLSLVVDEEKPKPLPNLDYKIVVGDSLVSKFDGEVVEIEWNRTLSSGKGDEYLANIKRLLLKVAAKQKKYFNPDNKDKKKLTAEIRDLKIELLINQISLNRLIYINKNVEVIDSGFGLSAKEKIKNTQIKITIATYDNLLKKLTEIKKQHELPFNHFDWKLDFPEILNPYLVGENAGFDIVIGNPPYLESRSPAFNDEMKDNIRDSIKTRLKNDIELISRGSDLLIYFFEKSISLISSNGWIVLITQNAWLDTDYGKNFQEFLLKHTHVSKIIDSDFKHFNSKDGPNINTVITVFMGNRPINNALSFIKFSDQFSKENKSSSLTYHFEKATEIKSYKYDDEILRLYKWGILLKSEAMILDLILRLRERGKSLDKIFDCNLSVGQGLNLTKDHLVDFEVFENYNDLKNIAVPIMTSDDGAPFILLKTQNYLFPQSRLNGNIVSKLKQLKIKIFVDDSTSKKPPIFILPRGIGRHFCCHNSINAYSSSFVEIYDNDSNISEGIMLNLWLFLNSSICWLLREISGRKNLGGGMLKAEATDLKSFPLYFDFKKIDQIRKIYNSVSTIQVQSPLIELDVKHHIKIDQIVFDFLEINLEERNLFLAILKSLILNRTIKSKT